MEKNSGDKAGRQRLGVLLIDDEPDLCELAQMRLEQEEFLVVTARDGQRALDLLALIVPDVIVTDLMMPVLDGFEFIKRYHQRFASPAPVIAMSALEPYVKKAVEVGADAAFHKPVDFTKMVETIRNLATGRRERVPPSGQPARVDEATRLRQIFALQLDVTAPEPAMHELTQLIASHFNVPIALISIVTEDRQFWTAGCGIPEDLAAARGTPRSESFCTHAVSSRAALVVQDTRDNPFFRDNPFTTTRGIRFYAGVPLFGRHGEAVGTICLLDHGPRTFTHLDLEVLGVFGRCVLGMFEQREHQASPAIPEGAFRYLELVDPELDIFGKRAFGDLAIVEGARAAAAQQELTCVALAVPARRLKETVHTLRARKRHDIVGRLGHARLGWLVRDVSLETALELARSAGGPHSFVEAVRLDTYAGAIPVALSLLEGALGDAGLV
jgi:DNA-binding response OmpR family regulator